MKAKFINALAEVLDIDLRQYNHMTQDEVLAMLEDRQAKELATV